MSSQPDPGYGAERQVQIPAKSALAVRLKRCFGYGVKRSQCSQRYPGAARGPVAVRPWELIAGGVVDRREGSGARWWQAATFWCAGGALGTARPTPRGVPEARWGQRALPHELFGQRAPEGNPPCGHLLQVEPPLVQGFQGLPAPTAGLRSSARMASTNRVSRRLDGVVFRYNSTYWRAALVSFWRAAT